MFKLLKTILVLTLTLFSLAGCSLLMDSGEANQPNSALTEGQAVPDLTLLNQDGESVSLKDYAGKTVYINVWASWCGPCKREFPELEKVYQAHKDKEDVVFLSVVSANDDTYGNSNPADKSKKTILSVAKKGKITYPVLFDQNDSFMEAFGVRSFPTHIVIKPDGTIASVTLGSTTAKTLTQLIKKGQ